MVAHAFNNNGKKKGDLGMNGRLLEIACRRKAKRLGIERYTWAQLAQDSHTSEAGISRATRAHNPQLPRYDTVLKWWEALKNGDDLLFQDEFFNAFGYASPHERAAVGQYVEQLEKQE